MDFSKIQAAFNNKNKKNEIKTAPKVDAAAMFNLLDLVFSPIVNKHFLGTEVDYLDSVEVMMDNLFISSEDPPMSFKEISTFL